MVALRRLMTPMCQCRDVTYEPSVQADLLRASAGVVPVPNGKPWDHGWAYADYRHSGEPVMSSPSGPVSLAGEHLQAYERATSSLLRESAVRDRWHREEFWSVIGSLVVATYGRVEREAFVAQALLQLRTVGPSLVVMLIANAKWVGPPAAVGDVILGLAGDEYFETLLEISDGRALPAVDRWTQWLDNQIATRPGVIPPVVLGTWVPGQGMLATEQAQRRMEDVVGLCMLLGRDLSGRGIFRRGSTNRPGIRGLRLDRGALEAGLQKSARIELSSAPLVVGDLLHSTWVSWNSAEPLLLADLLEDLETRNEIASSLSSQDPVSQSLRVAARWFTEGHYADAEDDAALALGVALDALLTGKRSLPGSAMADRYAMLSPEPRDRKELVAQYLKLYGVRSSVAHGG